MSSIINKIIGGKYKSTQASSFWMNDDFDVEFKSEAGIDYTKLAAAQRAIGNFVNIVTGKSIPVVFQSSDDSYTDGEKVVIGTKLDGKNFDPAVGLALHEGSHIALTDFSMFKTPAGNYAGSLTNTKMAQICQFNGLDPDMTMTNQEFDIVKNLLNWVEDRRIDFNIYKSAPGYRMYYEAMYDTYFNDKVVDKALAAGEKNQETWDDYFFHIINFTNPNRNLDTLVALRDIWNTIDLRNISRLKSTDDALLVAIDVYKKVKAAIDNAPKQESNQSSNNGEDEQGEGNGSGGSEGGGGKSYESDGEGSVIEPTESNIDTKGASSLSPAEQKKLDKAIEAQRKFLKGEMKKTGRLTKTQASVVRAIQESGTETVQVATGAGNEDIIDTIVIRKLTPGIITAMPRLFCYNASEYTSGIRNFEEDVKRDSWKVRDIIGNQEAVNKGIILGKQLGKKLQLRNADRSLKSTRLESGKIDRRLISQLGYDNANVFHRIVTDRFKNYFIHISIDASGSMDGRKLRAAITSAVAVAQAASMTTGIRVQISLRGTDHVSNKERCVTVYAYDSAKDKMSKIRSMFRYLGTFGCTPEGLAFKSIEKYIKADAKGDECIFVNYSDGAPTNVAGCSYFYDGIAFTHKVISNFRENNINIVSYFIADIGYDYGKAEFQRMYGSDSQYIDPANMMQVAKTLNQKFLEIAQ
jgi:uncharacterized membrane protein YgcG